MARILLDTDRVDVCIVRFPYISPNLPYDPSKLKGVVVVSLQKGISVGDEFVTAGMDIVKNIIGWIAEGYQFFEVRLAENAKTEDEVEEGWWKPWFGASPRPLMDLLKIVDKANEIRNSGEQVCNLASQIGAVLQSGG